MSAQEIDKRFRIGHLPPYLLGTVAAQVLEARSAGRDIVDLSQVNPSLKPPQRAIDRLVQTVLLPQSHRYSSSQGLLRLREKICAHYQRSYGVELSPTDDAVMCMGIKEGLAHLLLAVLSPGDQVLIPTPAYPLHTSSVFIAHGSVIGVPLYDVADNGLTFPTTLTGASDAWFERLSHAYQLTWPRPKLLLVSFPHNPTTITVDLSFFERLVEFAKLHELWLVHDFAYADINFGSYRAPSILQVPEAKEVAVEFFSLSKGCGVAGWRVGFCLGNSALIHALKKIKSYLDFGLFQPLQVAAIDVLEEHQHRISDVVAEYQQRRDVLVQGLRSGGWEVVEPQATVFVWVRLPQRFRAQGSIEFSRYLLESAQVAVCPGEAFDIEAKEYVRFALVENEARLRKAVTAISRVLAIFVIFIIPAFARADDCADAVKLMNKGTELNDGSLGEEEFFRKAIAACPKLAEAHYNLGRNLLKQSKIAEAITSFKQAIIERNEAIFVVALGNAFVLKGDFAEAEAEYQKAIKLDPGNDAALRGLAVVYERQGQLTQAEDMLRQAIQFKPDEAANYLNIGLILHKLGRADEAVVSFETALDKNPNLADAYLNLAETVLASGNPARAEQSLKKGILIEPNNIRLWSVLGRLYEKSGKVDQAKDAFARAVALSPGDSSSLANLGIVLVKAGDLDEGIAKLQAATQANQSDSVAQGALGWAYLIKRELASAESSLMTAVKLNENNALAHNNLGVLFELKGEKDKALEHYDKAAKLDPKLNEAVESLRRLRE